MEEAIDFIHLEMYSEYSIKYSIIDIDEVLDLASKDGHGALAITDHQNLFAWIKFYNSAKKRKIKPICGLNISISNYSDLNITLLCANYSGYITLLNYISLSYQSGLHGKWLLEWLFKPLTGVWIIILQSEKNDEEKIKIAKANIKQTVFSISRCGKLNEESLIYKQYQLAEQLSLPIIASHSMFFLKKEDFEAHEIRVCIYEGYEIDDNNKPHNHTPQQHWLDKKEIQLLFKDAPKAIKNAYQIGVSCNLEIEQGVYHLPIISPQGNLSLKEYIWQLTENGMLDRLKKKKHKYPNEKYLARLNYELNLIDGMGFNSYFLIVSDFIKWAKENNIAVGPGRGSGAGSLVAYALGITDLDPLEYNLLFERFLNPERVSMPDFDIDFCMINRDKVIHYVQGRYGKECVSQIITYGTMAAKAAVRDVGRALGQPYGFVDKIAKLIPFELGIKLKKALEDEPILAQRYQDEEEVKQLFDLALKLEGKVRNVGKHAGGVVISPKSLKYFTPIYMDKITDMPITQYDKDDLEKIGLVKFDFLGLRTLTLIQWTLENILINNKDFDLNNIPLDDKKTFEHLSLGDTVGVFQLESSSGMRDLVIRLGPDCFEDLIAVVALYRPGPMEQADDFIMRKKGAKIDYLHHLCEEILKPTYGIMVYQEQVMQIAQKVANYTLGGADILRRAMGKKKPEEMVAQRSIFVSGAKQNNLSDEEANNLFNLIEKFAGYGFNKSHAAAYALLSFQTAYLKCHYPDAFIAAILSSEMDNTDKLVSYIKETKRLKIVLLPPCVKYSQPKFHVEKTNHIRYGLAAIKGLGTEVAYQISQDQKLKNMSCLKDYVEYAYHKYRFSRKTFEALAKSGAMDILYPCRGTILNSIDCYLQSNNSQKSLEPDLFSSIIDQQQDWIKPKVLSQKTILKMELEILGWYASKHLITYYKQEATALGVASLSQLTSTSKNETWIVAMVKSARRLNLKSGKRACFWLLEDENNELEVGAFDHNSSKWSEYEKYSEPLLLNITIKTGNYRRYILENILTFDEIRKMQSPCIKITLNDSWRSDDTTMKLKNLIENNRGNSKIYWETTVNNEAIKWQHGSVIVSESLLKELDMLKCTYDFLYNGKI